MAVAICPIAVRTVKLLSLQLEMFTLTTNNYVLSTVITQILGTYVHADRNVRYQKKMHVYFEIILYLYTVIVRLVA